MSDDLVNRLRDNTRNYDDKITDRLDAADRIEELEAKLARAVEDFETMADTDPDDGTTWFHEFAHAAIAKIKGDHP